MAGYLVVILVAVLVAIWRESCGFRQRVAGASPDRRSEFNRLLLHRDSSEDPD
jgi:hypothetical protein